MSDLRKEYNEHKQNKADMIEEASSRWVEKNIVLISEKISRRTVKALTDKIVKFDRDFGAFKKQLPAIADQIAQAENGLQKIITGRSNEDKAMKLLKQLAYLYNSYSEYFNRDLPVLLATPLLRGAQANPEVKLNVLQTPGHDPSIIRDAFKHSLEPSKEELKLLKKIYRGKQPLINATEISTQMLNLSYNELLQLTGTEKVPMVDFPPEAQEEPPSEELPVDAQQPPIEEPLKESTELLEEEFDQEKLALLMTSLERIDSNISNVPGLEQLTKNIGALKSMARKDMTKGAVGSAIEKINPLQSSAVKQAALFSNVISKMSDAWPTVRKMFSDNEGTTLDNQEQQELINLLSKAADDGMFGAIGRAFGTQHWQGLDPKTVAQSIGSAGVQATLAGDSQLLANIDKVFAVAEDAPTGDELLAQGSTETAETAETGETKETAATDTASQAKQTTPAAHVDDTVPADKISNLLDSLKQQGFSPTGETPEEVLKSLLDTVNSAGLDLKSR